LKTELDNKSIVQLGRVSTIEALTTALRNDIYNGVWKPGSQITEQELVERFNVSRHSIRETLVLLVNQGYLEKRVNKGVFVRTFSARDIEDMFFARKLFEEVAIRELAKKRHVPDELRLAAAAIRKRKKDDPWSIVITSDMNFHRTLVDSLGSPRVSMLYSSLLVDFELINKQPQNFETDMEQIYGIHTRIIETIEQGDAAQAVLVLREHLQDACRTQIEEWATQE
jgi:DNA-binding GntR family transcriptional regulator